MRPALHAATGQQAQPGARPQSAVGAAGSRLERTVRHHFALKRHTFGQLRRARRMPQALAAAFGPFEVAQRQVGLSCLPAGDLRSTEFASASVDRLRQLLHEAPGQVGWIERVIVIDVQWHHVGRP